MIPHNPIKVAARIKELFIDWLVLSAYLILLLGAAMGIYFGLLDGIPHFTELQSQLLITGTSVLPLVLIFAWQDFRGGSFGKRKAGLTVHFERRSFGASLVRNAIKFLPWQLGHMGTAHSINSGWDVWSAMLSFGGMGLAVIMLGMGLFRADKRHLGDLIARTQVRPN